MGSNNKERKALVHIPQQFLGFMAINLAVVELKRSCAAVTSEAMIIQST